MPLLDLVLGYDCNLACTYCTITDAMRARSLPLERLAAAIEQAAKEGFKAIAFTGGEPTIFEDLPRLIRFAKGRGFDDIKVASNGLRYAYAPYLELLIACGVTRFHVSMHAFGDDAYERTVRREGAAALRERALKNLFERGLEPVFDLILKEDTYRELEPWVDDLAKKGARRFALWWVSLTDQNAPNVEQLPRMSDVAPVLRRVFAKARAGGYEVRSLHVPRCLVPGDEAHVEHPGMEGVRVVTPDATFDLAASRLSGGVKAEACKGCRWEPRCPGLREDYVARFGVTELSKQL